MHRSVAFRESDYCYYPSSILMLSIIIYGLERVEFLFSSFLLHDLRPPGAEGFISHITDQKQKSSNIPVGPPTINRKLYDTKKMRYFLRFVVFVSIIYWERYIALDLPVILIQYEKRT